MRKQKPLMHVFPTYGIFKLDMQSEKRRFEYSRDELEINLNSSLKLLEAFRTYASNTKFQLFGSLFGYFPYMRVYVNSLWYINKIVADPANKFLNIVVHNLGRMMIKFWWRKELRDALGHFVYKEIQTETILK
ncbi:MAG: hypothetical protein ACI83B_001324 [Sediminicola sp.]|jgi:hypothetical protein